MMNQITDWFSGVHYHGLFRGAVQAALRLAYLRGIFDGFLLGAVLVLIISRRRNA